MSAFINSLKSLASSAAAFGEDTRLKFSVTPSPGDSGFAQWHSAMKMVARLPEGIPHEFRKTLWLTLAEQHLAARGVDWPQVSRSLFNEWTNPDDEELGVQIVKDLHRTGCSLFCGQSGQHNQAVLKRVLLAYARWNKNVGYCQGFNMLAALILQVMDRSQPNSVKVMIYLIEGVLPESYFANNLRGLSVDMAVFRELLKLRFPALSRHLDQLQNDSKDSGTSYEPPLTNVFTMQWFLTLFCNCLPQSMVLRVWDLIFLEGNEILLKTALAIWDSLSDRIMAVDSADEFYSIMGVLTREMLEIGLMDADHLVKAISSISLPELGELREKYMYNITPWSAVAKRGLRLFYSDEDTDTSDDDEKVAVAAAYALFRSPKHKDQLASDREKIALDISALKKQYCKLRERQRQAHIILSAACGGGNLAVTNPMSPAMNHLLLNKKPLLTSKTHRLPPIPGSIPPPLKHQHQVKQQEEVGTTIPWESSEKKRRQVQRATSATESLATDQSEEVSDISNVSSRRNSNSSSSSSSTELCDDPDPDDDAASDAESLPVTMRQEPAPCKEVNPDIAVSSRNSSDSLHLRDEFSENTEGFREDSISSHLPSSVDAECSKKSIEDIREDSTSSHPPPSVDAECLKKSTKDFTEDFPASYLLSGGADNSKKDSTSRLSLLPETAECPLTETTPLHPPPSESVDTSQNASISDSPPSESMISVLSPRNETVPVNPASDRSELTDQNYVINPDDTNTSSPTQPVCQPALDSKSSITDPYYTLITAPSLSETQISSPLKFLEPEFQPNKQTGVSLHSAKLSTAPSIDSNSIRVSREDRSVSHSGAQISQGETTETSSSTESNLKGTENKCEPSRAETSGNLSVFLEPAIDSHQGSNFLDFEERVVQGNFFTSASSEDISNSPSSAKDRLDTSHVDCKINNLFRENLLTGLDTPDKKSKTFEFDPKVGENSSNVNALDRSERKFISKPLDLLSPNPASEVSSSQFSPLKDLTEYRSDLEAKYGHKSFETLENKLSLEGILDGSEDLRNNTDNHRSFELDLGKEKISTPEEISSSVLKDIENEKSLDITSLTSSEPSEIISESESTEHEHGQILKEYENPENAKCLEEETLDQDQYSNLKLKLDIENKLQQCISSMKKMELELKIPLQSDEETCSQANNINPNISEVDTKSVPEHASIPVSPIQTVKSTPKTLGGIDEDKSENLKPRRDSATALQRILAENSKILSRIQIQRTDKSISKLSDLDEISVRKEVSSRGSFEDSTSKFSKTRQYSSLDSSQFSFFKKGDISKHSLGGSFSENKLHSDDYTCLRPHQRPLLEDVEDKTIEEFLQGSVSSHERETPIDEVVGSSVSRTQSTGSILNYPLQTSSELGFERDGAVSRLKSSGTEFEMGSLEKASAFSSGFLEGARLEIGSEQVNISSREDDLERFPRVGSFSGGRRARSQDEESEMSAGTAADETQLQSEYFESVTTENETEKFTSSCESSTYDLETMLSDSPPLHHNFPSSRSLYTTILSHKFDPQDIVSSPLDHLKTDCLSD
nr:PREDICTED: uncharacterized protein LOC109041322 isoform X2 [Bemisia tabaci]XP_018913187.1 PREDICTED: uncharacterized protein LOC109041322 isoform X2 [Bemisia tabaci]XP_018913188.1 PREDICTED: uncharacterized protein LOC109041322 isoform X2 [Bemisia tabaci]XP_018913189.1 PREDICTED: uncharacterized protein LOC109041322 isoform X2 [Bemisia tabaci]